MLGLLDNMLINDYQAAEASETRAVRTSTSHHYLAWHNIPNLEQKGVALSQAPLFLVNKQTMSNFISTLSNLDWPNFTEYHDTERACNDYYQKFIGIFQDCFSITERNK